MLVTQYEGSVIESTGLIKMDFLGLKTLSIIKEALLNIKERWGKDVDIDHIPLDDPKTYESIAKDGLRVHSSLNPRECRSILESCIRLRLKT